MSEQDALERYNEELRQQEHSESHYYTRLFRPPQSVRQIMLEDETIITSKPELDKALDFVHEMDGSSWVRVVVGGKEIARYNCRYLSSIVWE